MGGPVAAEATVPLVVGMVGAQVAIDTTMSCIRDALHDDLDPRALLGVLAVFARERDARMQGLAELNTAYRGTALVLGDVVEADDGYTGEHCRDVVQLAVAVGRRTGLPADRLRNLEFAALLHDVGKVAVPKSIINKPGALPPRSGLDANEAGPELRPVARVDDGVQPVAEANGETMCQLYAAHARTNSDSRTAARCGSPK